MWLVLSNKNLHSEKIIAALTFSIIQSGCEDIALKIESAEYSSQWKQHGYCSSNKVWQA